MKKTTIVICDKHKHVLEDKRNAAILEQWAEDLVSGDYKQCKGKLKKPSGFCCLGVLEHVQGSEIIKSQAMPGGMLDPIFLVSGNKKILPENLMFNVKGSWLSDVVGLSSLNDKYNLTFDQIAYLLINHEIEVPYVSN